MEVLFNPHGINYPGVQGWIEWASWVWNLRTQVEVTFGGITSRASPEAGQTIIRLATASEWVPSAGNTQANAWTLESGNGSTILLNPNVPIHPLYEKLVIHELGHALGYFTIFGGEHSNDRNDIMHYAVSEDTFPVSTADANGVISFSRLPKHHAPDTKSAVLGPDFDLYHPDINGRQVWLDYLGIVNGRPAWDIASVEINEESTGSASYLSGNMAFVPLVHSMDQDYANVVLEVVGSQVQLVSWA